MNTIRLNVQGCDDTTTVDIEVTDEQLAFLRRLAILVAESSTYGCQPTIEVVELEPK
jgi:hypothetical protein